jgi:hypothetical protein
MTVAEELATALRVDLETSMIGDGKSMRRLGLSDEIGGWPTVYMIRVLFCPGARGGGDADNDVRLALVEIRHVMLSLLIRTWSRNVRRALPRDVKHVIATAWLGHPCPLDDVIRWLHRLGAESSGEQA